MQDAGCGVNAPKYPPYILHPESCILCENNSPPVCVLNHATRRSRVYLFTRR